MITERIRFESQEVMLGGRLALPDSGIARLGVLCITGGGLDDCDVPYLEWQSYMAENDIASLSFNARGMGDSAGCFRTDSPGFDPKTSPANSQASRATDTFVAHNLLKKYLGIKNNKHTGVIGGSMGGDIALHAALEDTGALVLRAPSAYPNEVHDIAYGPEWGPMIRDLGGDTAALQSSNFERIRSSGLPILLIFSAGDKVIPKIVQDKYIASVEEAGGKVEIVGDETTPHTYINDSTRPEKDTETNRVARERTFALTTRFFLRNLA